MVINKHLLVWRIKLVKKRVSSKEYKTDTNPEVGGDLRNDELITLVVKEVIAHQVNIQFL